ncbi:hypothetical protein [Halorubrum ezzemoulense]|uniref:hypothetical protein n=1 Tax=Halorubrum ezzemoulense TaxID=337243 RepID=UPI00232D71EB|nr:hypothetical protein [Halorubrum ezzemoulense]MDB2237071.1 hypothetical protein [Halorubrum ezzemoulense]
MNLNVTPEETVETLANELEEVEAINYYGVVDFLDAVSVSLNSDLLAEYVADSESHTNHCLQVLIDGTHVMHGVDDENQLFIGVEKFGEKTQNYAVNLK